MTATTTIRVSTEIRDRLNVLSAREGESAGDIVAKLVRAADDDLLLAEAEAAFERLIRDPRVLAAYRSETGEIEDGFGATAPAW